MSKRVCISMSLAGMMFGTLANGAISTTSVSLIGGGDSYQINAWTEPDLQGFGASVHTTFSPPTLTSTDYTLGVGAAWFEVAAGTTIDGLFAAAARSGSPFADSHSGTVGNSLVIPFVFQQPLLLGFVLDLNDGSNPIFGWAGLKRDGSGLILTGSGTSADSIVAGQVPEPATVLLTTVSGLVLVRIRRRS